MVFESSDSSLSSFGGLPAFSGMIGTLIHQRVMDVTHAFMIQPCISVSNVHTLQSIC